MTIRRILLAVAALALFTAGALQFGPSYDRDVTGDVQPAVVAVAGSGGLPANGPIPCLDGSTVEFGEWCPLPQIQCSNGSTVPIGQFCPPAGPGPTPQPLEPEPPQPAPTTKTCSFSDGSITVGVNESCPAGRDCGNYGIRKPGSSCPYDPKSWNPRQRSLETVHV